MRKSVLIPVVEPFDFSLSLEFLRGFGPMAGEQRLADGALTKAWIVRGVPVTATVHDARGGLSCRLEAPQGIDEALAVSRVRSFLSAGEDLADFYAIASRDRAFAPVAR